MSAPATAEEPSIPTQAAFVLGSAVAYFCAYKLNTYWFEWFEFSHGASWIYIPSGLRLLCVLVIARHGSLGIAISSVFINYNVGDPQAHVFNVVTGLISGASPYLARLIAIQWFKLDTHLSNLNAKVFFNVSVVFAVVNALTHQLWFFWNHETENFMASFLAMGVGDWFGTVLVLATASLGIKIYKLQRS